MNKTTAVLILGMSSALIILVLVLGAVFSIFDSGSNPIAEGTVVGNDSNKTVHESEILPVNASLKLIDNEVISISFENQRLEGIKAGVIIYQESLSESCRIESIPIGFMPLFEEGIPLNTPYEITGRISTTAMFSGSEYNIFPRSISLVIHHVNALNQIEYPDRPLFEKVVWTNPFVGVIDTPPFNCTQIQK